MRHWKGLLSLLAVAAFTLPSFGATAGLLNGNFDTGPAGRPPPSWTVWQDTPVDVIESASGDWIWNPAPTQFGVYSFRSGEWNSSGCRGGIWQQVTDLTPNVEHTLAFKWAWAGGTNPHSHAVGVSDGAWTNGNDPTPLNSATATNTTQDYWHTVELTFTPTGSTVTVWTTVAQSGSNWDAVATWVDEILLVEGELSDYQHELIGMEPTQIYDNTDPDPTHALVTGLNLEDVSVVNLVGLQTLVGTNIAIDPVEGEWLTVDFPTNGASYGVYSLEVQKPGFTTRTLTNVFTIFDPAAQHTVTAIIPRIARGNAVDVSVTIQGTNLADLSLVTLVQGGTTVTGTVTDVADDWTWVTVDLPISVGPAPLGVYDVVVEKTDKTTQQLTGGFTILDPASALLINGNFDAGPSGQIPTGWAEWTGWDDYDVNYVYDGISIWNPTPLYYGSYSYRIGGNSESGGDQGMYQQVPVIPGETLILTFKWAGGNQDDPVIHEVGVSAGALTGDFWNQGPLGIVRYGQYDAGLGAFNWGSAWEDRTLTFTVPPDTCDISVYTRLWMFSSSQSIMTWVDEMSLVVDPECADQHTLRETDPIDPTEYDGNSTFVMTLYGTNLNQVMAVRLVVDGIQGTPEVTGSSLNPNEDGTQLDVTFIPPAGGAPLGEYDLIVEQDGCRSTTLPNVFTYVCENHIVLDSIDLDPPELTKPQPQAVDLTILGENLDQVVTIRLEQAAPNPDNHNELPESQRVIAGVIQSVANPPTSMVVRFDLYNKASGSFDLIATRNDACPDPDPLVNALTLLLPAGDNLLVDPSFESGSTGQLDDPWQGDQAAEGPYPPGDFYGFTPYNGEYLAGAANNGSMTTKSIEQSLGLPRGAGDYGLVLDFYMNIWDGGTVGWGQPSTLTATIVADEGELGESSSSVTVSEKMGWWPAEILHGTVDFIGTASTDIKVKFDLVATGDGQTPWAVIVLDATNLVASGEPCKKPFADADGDMDVDQEDFAVFQLCFSDNGNDYPDTPEYCYCFNRPETPSDKDVDQVDWGKFEKCATGPGIVLDPEDETTWPGYGTVDACEGAGYTP